jgi:hypothetical protein
MKQHDNSANARKQVGATALTLCGTKLIDLWITDIPPVSDFFWSLDTSGGQRIEVSSEAGIFTPESGVGVRNGSRGQ